MLNGVDDYYWKERVTTQAEGRRAFCSVPLQCALILIAAFYQAARFSEALINGQLIESLTFAS